MSMNQTYVDKVASQLIEQLQQGTAPWQKPWKAGERRAPTNPATGKDYRGFNRLWLQMQGFSDPRWMTFNQAADAGARIRKGSQGTQIVFWSFTEERDAKDAAGNVIVENGKPQKIMMELEKPKSFTFTVFNAEQIDGLAPLEAKPVAPEAIRCVRAESLLLAAGAQIRHQRGDRAFYQPATDEIILPERDQFLSREAYFSTALHELGHWSGHRDRLDRDLAHPFGSREYAREELRAEIASLMLSEKLDLPHNPEQHASYVAAWIDILQNDPREIFRASADAARISEHLLSIENEKSQSVDISTQSEQLYSDRARGVEVTAGPSEHHQPVENEQLQSIDQGVHGPAQTEQVDDTPTMRETGAQSRDTAPEPLEARLSASLPATAATDEATDFGALVNKSGAQTKTPLGHDQLSEPAVRLQQVFRRMTNFISEFGTRGYERLKGVLASLLSKRETGSAVYHVSQDREAMRVITGPDGFERYTREQLEEMRSFLDELIAQRSQGQKPQSQQVDNAKATQLETVEDDAVAVAENQSDLKRVHLAIPYAEKDEAKAAAKAAGFTLEWDKTAKAWSAPADADLTTLAQWRPDEPVEETSSQSVRVGERDGFLATQQQLNPVLHEEPKLAEYALVDKEPRVETPRLKLTPQAWTHASSRADHVSPTILNALSAAKSALDDGNPAYGAQGFETPEEAEAKEFEYRMLSREFGIKQMPVNETMLWDPFFDEDAYWAGLQISLDQAREENSAEGEARASELATAFRALQARATVGVSDKSSQPASQVTDPAFEPKSQSEGLSSDLPDQLSYRIEGTNPVWVDGKQLFSPLDQTYTQLTDVLLAYKNDGLRINGAHELLVTKGEAVTRLIGHEYVGIDNSDHHYVCATAELEQYWNAIDWGSGDQETIAKLEAAAISSIEQLTNKNRLNPVLREEPAQSDLKRVHLAIPYAEKDEAKAAAKAAGFTLEWDKTAGAWSAPADADLTTLAQWRADEPFAATHGQSVRVGERDGVRTTQQQLNPVLHEEPAQSDLTRVYLAIPYAEKDEAKAAAKAAGFTLEWDKTAKAWSAPADADLTTLAQWRADGMRVVTPANSQSAVEQFAQALRAEGLIVDGAPIMDGRLHRVPVEDERSGKTSGAYIGHLHGQVPAGYIQNFKTGVQITWKADSAVDQLSPDERARLRAEAAVQREARSKERLALQEQTSVAAMALWNEALPATTENAYCKAKGVSETDIAGLRLVPDVVSPETAAFGICIAKSVDEAKALRAQDPNNRVFKAGDLLIPGYDLDGRLWTLQSVTPYFKSLMKDGRKAGLMTVAGAEDLNAALGKHQGQPLIVAEGFATASSISKITGQTVVVAFDSGNLSAVCEELRERYPTRPMFIAADNDHQALQKTGPNGKPMPNVGMEKAREAAEKFGAGVIAPDFAASDKGSDWNDFLESQGEEITRRHFAGKMTAARVEATVAAQKIASLADEHLNQLQNDPKVGKDDEVLAQARVANAHALVYASAQLDEIYGKSANAIANERLNPQNLENSAIDAELARLNESVREERSHILSREEQAETPVTGQNADQAAGVLKRRAQQRRGGMDAGY